MIDLDSPSPPSRREPEGGAVARSGQRPSHNPVLDGVRGLAILLVVLHHHTVMTGAAALDLGVATISHFGGVGVDLFFVLSGFLITGILLRARATADQPGARYFRNFYARRTLRIFPLYYAVVFVALVVLPQIDHPKANNFGRIEGDEWSYWLYLSNFTIAEAGRWRHAILDVSWSLAIEEQFYLVWPLVVRYCSLTVLRRTAIAMVVGALLFRLFGTYWLGWNLVTTTVLTPGRLDTLALGALLAIAASGAAAKDGGRGGLLPLRPSARWLAWPCALGGLGLFLADEWRRAHWSPGEPRVISWSQTVGFSLTAFAFASILVLAVTASPTSRTHRFWCNPVLRTFGKYSYAMYLFHLPIRALVRDLAFGPPGTGAKFIFPIIGGSQIPAQLLFHAITIPLALGAAWLSWHCYEKWFLRLKRYFE